MESNEEQPESIPIDTTPDTDIVATENSELARTALFSAVLFITVLILIFNNSFLSMVDIWERSDTFAHGFLIPLISLWLIWRKRHLLLIAGASSSWYWLVLFSVSALAWLIGSLAKVLVVEQLSVVLMLITGLVTVVGPAMGRIMAFPLAFLLLMVPMGEELIAPMMEFTATSTVWLIRAAGVPVFREGLYFSLPSGNWSVVEACSGVRYLIASFALGLLYAYITYQTLYKRLIFVLFSIAVPILANSLRAFMIVMIGHYSDMKHAVGVDHLIYGWVFFGVVIFLMFWIGSYFSEDPRATSVEFDSSKKTQPSLMFKIVVVALLGVSLSISHLRSRILTDISTSESASVPMAVLEGVRPTKIRPNWSWQPRPIDPDDSISSSYRIDNTVISLFENHYFKHSQGAELVNSLDRWVPEGAYGWRVMSHSARAFETDSGDVSVEGAILSNGRDSILAWRWYSIGGRHISDPYLAKFYETLMLFDPATQVSSRYYVATSLDGSVETSEAALKHFVRKLTSSLSKLEMNRSIGIDKRGDL